MSDGRRPSAVLRLLYRSGALPFRLGLDRAFDHRLLLLEHVGRKTGALHRTPLEVVRYEAATKTYYVASAYGHGAQWLRNVEAEPEVRVRVAGREWPALAVVANEAWSAEELRDYARRHPRLAAGLARFLGLPTDGTPDGFAALAPELPVVQLAYDPSRDSAAEL